MRRVPPGVPLVRTGLALGAVALGAVAFGVSGCGSDHPSVTPGRTADATVDAWRSALDAGDFDGACNVLTSAAVRSLRDGDVCARALERFHRRYPRLEHPYFLTSFAGASGGTSVASFDVTRRHGGPAVRLAQRDGEWVITGIDR